MHSNLLCACLQVPAQLAKHRVQVLDLFLHRRIVAQSEIIHAPRTYQVMGSWIQCSYIGGV
jgi:hypothetical protein